MAKEANWLRREADVARFLSTARKLREIADRIEALEAALNSASNALMAVADLKGWREREPISDTGRAVMRAIAVAEAANGEKA